MARRSKAVRAARAAAAVAQAHFGAAEADGDPVTTLGAYRTAMTGADAVADALIDARILSDVIDVHAYRDEVMAAAQVDRSGGNIDRWAATRPWPQEFTVDDVPQIRALTHFPNAMVLHDALPSLGVLQDRFGGDPDAADVMAARVWPMLLPLAASRVALSVRHAFMSAKDLPTGPPDGSAGPPRVWPRAGATVYFDRDVPVPDDRRAWSATTLGETSAFTDMESIFAGMDLPRPETANRPAMTRINVGIADTVCGVTLPPNRRGTPDWVIWHVATRVDESEREPGETPGRGYRGVVVGRRSKSLLHDWVDIVAARAVAASAARVAPDLVDYRFVEPATQTEGLTPEWDAFDSARDWGRVVPGGWYSGSFPGLRLPVTVI